MAEPPLEGAPRAAAGRPDAADGPREQDPPRARAEEPPEHDPPRAHDPPSPPSAPRLTARRLLGLDRSGPPPPQTQAGQPLRPWTIPNAIGFTRLALIPAFLVVALSSSDGTGALPATLFGVIGWGDYADGIAARLTRQYSRLGALMDPVTDRLLVVSGVVVTWRFHLLPRWALAVLAARELAMLALGRYGISHRVELRINWPGRISVAPVMGSFFFAITGLHAFSEALLFVGLAMALLASALYARDGALQLRAAAHREPRPPIQ